jgi:hypothetical protein
MFFTLQHRQAVVMRADAALEHGVAVVEQVVGGDGGRDVGRRGRTNSAAWRVVMCSSTIFSAGTVAAAASRLGR